MAFCKTCGNEIDEKASICVKCGVPTEQYSQSTQNNQDEMLPAVIGSIVAVLATIFIPIIGVAVGAILCGVLWNSKPKAAKAIGISTAVSFGFLIICVVFIMFFTF